MDAPLYMHFCRPDSLFHDVPPLDRGLFALATAAPPAGWTRSVNREWVTLLPPAPLPRQGWKVHVSATPEEAEGTLAATYEHCVERGLPFKFLKSGECVLARSSKYADRAGSGKFVTIYPRTDAELDALLEELGERLEGRRGPYILSDVRWRSGPLFIRYGAFQPFQLRTEDGELQYAVEGPDGRLEPDVRGPGFRPPSWAPLPGVVEQAVAERGGSRLGDFPYRPTQALHFSNGGGVYRGVAEDGSPVLLKEARPLAGLDSSGADAVARLERERWAYETLAGVPGVPALLDFRRGHEHYFLVREEVPGQDLQHLVFARNPLLRGAADPAACAAYAAWALGVLDRVEEGLDAMHGRGVVWADLHPGNVLVDDDGRVSFIDLEASRPVDDPSSQFMAAPGYTAPPGHTGTAIDRYALGVMRMAVFVPLPSLLNWEQGKLEEFLGFVHEHFPVPAGYDAQVLADLALDTPGRAPGAAGDGDSDGVAARLARQVTPSGWPTPRPDDPAEGRAAWRTATRRLADGILATADPAREDRLYPGDVQQFLRPGAGLGLAHGAAGVQWALRSAGFEVPPEHRAWLCEAVQRQASPDPGLVDGLAGVALALVDLGEAALGEELLDRALATVDDRTPWRLSDGLAGLGLAAVHAASRAADPLRRARLVRVAGELAERLDAWDPAGAPGARTRPGLLTGAAGPAAFAVGLHGLTGEPRLLARAAELLRFDVAAQRARPNPTSPGALSPLLAHGAGGTALVADALRAARGDDAAPGAPDRPGLDDLARLCEDVHAASAAPFWVEGGLFAGRAGVMAVGRGLARSDAGPDAGSDPAALRHLGALRLHVVGLGAHLAVLAPLALRLSADLATGAAGVLLAVSAATAPAAGRSAPELPFLPPRPDTPPSPPRPARDARLLEGASA